MRLPASCYGQACLHVQPGLGCLASALCLRHRGEAGCLRPRLYVGCRPASGACGVPAGGWHGRRGTGASTLYRCGRRSQRRVRHTSRHHLRWCWLVGDGRWPRPARGTRRHRRQGAGPVPSSSTAATRQRCCRPGTGGRPPLPQGGPAAALPAGAVGQPASERGRQWPTSTTSQPPEPPSPGHPATRPPGPTPMGVPMGEGRRPWPGAAGWGSGGLGGSAGVGPWRGRGQGLAARPLCRRHRRPGVPACQLSPQAGRPGLRPWAAGLGLGWLSHGGPQPVQPQA